MLQWICFPRSAKATPLALSVVAAFEASHVSFTSDEHTLNRHKDLARVATHLKSLGFAMESRKKKSLKISALAFYDSVEESEKETSA
jgi:hypothetical protein